MPGLDPGIFLRRAPATDDAARRQEILGSAYSAEAAASAAKAGSPRMTSLEEGA
jgi:hypothetical protein